MAGCFRIILQKINQTSWDIIKSKDPFPYASTDGSSYSVFDVSDSPDLAAVC